MNKFDGLEIVLTEKQENLAPKRSNKKSFFNYFVGLAFCGIVALLAVFNLLTPVKAFLQSEYDYSKKNIVIFPVSPVVALPTSLTIKKPFASASYEQSGELILTPYEMCTVKAGAMGIVNETTSDSDDRHIKIKLQNGCVIKYSGLTYIGVEEGLAVSENSPIGFATDTIKISAYLNEIRIPLTFNENGDITWQN